MEISMQETAAKESALVERARKGDLKAFTELVDAYQQRAIRVAYSMTGDFEDARDLAQEAFVKAYENLADFKAQSRFYTWFYRILANGCKDHLRKKKVRSAISLMIRRQDGDEQESAEQRIADLSRNAKENLIDRELGLEISKAVEKLPVQQKLAFTLRYFEDMSMEEIGQSMQLSIGGVKAHLWQAAQKVRANLKPYVEMEAR